MDTSDFLARFQAFLARAGRRAVSSPHLLLQQWKDFVETCEDGYRDTIYDFDNEMSVREVLAVLLASPEFAAYPQLDGVREALEPIDERFKRTCRDDVTIRGPEEPWWRRYVPRNAEADLAEDLKSYYGIDPQ